MRWARYLDPFFVLDFYDPTGRPDHQKLMTAAIVGSVVWAQLAGRPFGTATVIVLGAIGFGPRMFGLFLRSRQEPPR